jgi:taurine transport system substrate-binding protein
MSKRTRPLQAIYRLSGNAQKPQPERSQPSLLKQFRAATAIAIAFGLMGQARFLRLIDRRRFNLLLGLFSLSAALIMAACSPSPGTLAPPSSGVAPAQIRIGYQASPNAELLVKAMGTAEKAFPNSKVIWNLFDSGRQVNTAMAAGDLDLGLVGSTGASIGIASQLPYQVYFIQGVIGDNEALVVRGNVRSLADLQGKKVAVPFGSTEHFSFLAALQELGLDANDLTILDRQPAAIWTAWRQGEIDAGFVAQPTLSKMVSAKGSVLVTTRGLYQKGIITADVGVAQKDLIARYPGTLNKYVELLDEAVKFYREQPEQAAAAIAPELGLSTAESLRAMKQVVWLSSAEQASAKYLGSAEKPGAFASVLRDSAAFMKSQGALPGVPDLEDFKAGIYSGGVAQ